MFLGAKAQRPRPTRAEAKRCTATFEAVKRALKRAVDFWWSQGIAYDAPALAFYLLVSLAPLALGIAALSGIVFSDYLSPEKVGEAIAGRFPEELSEKIITLAESARNKPSALVGSVLLMLWTSSAALGVIDRVMLRVVGEDGAGMILGRLRMVGFGALFAALLTIGLAGAAAVGARISISREVNLVGGAIVLYLGCLLLYRFLPKPGTKWRGAALGAVPASLALALCPYAVALYTSFGRITFAGIFAFIAILILSCYLMATGLLMGAGLALEPSKKENGK